MKNLITKSFNLRSLLKTVICLAFLFACTSSAVFACTCVPGAPAFLAESSKANLIIIGKVTGTEPANPANPFGNNIINVEVQRILKGDNTVQNVKVSTASSSSLCGVSMPINSKWVFALNLLGTETNNVPQSSISICSKNFLYVGAGKVFGQIKNDRYKSMPLPSFIKSLSR